MADIGHQQTDAVLAEIEDRVRQVYLQAARETQAKLNDYMRRYRKKDAVWQRRVAAGEVTQQEYTQWRTGQLMMTQRWEEMRDTLAADYHNANAIARSIVNGYMPDVYSLNHNFATFQVEKSGHIDTSYTLYSRETIERILRHEPELLPPPGAQMTRNLAEWDAFKEGRLDEVSAQNLEAFRSLQVAGKDLRWQKGQLQSVMTQAILQGESIPNIAKRVATEMGDYNHKSTIRYARTAVTGAQNAGRQDAYQRATNMGIEMKREWIATIDMRTRHDHRNLHGQKRGVSEPFEYAGKSIMYPGDPAGPPDWIWNCFPGETKVASDSEIIRSYKNWYKGDLIRIKTASGVQLTSTVNHPILTPGGWVAAESFHKGDNLLVTRIGNGLDIRLNPHIQQTFTSIETIHHLLALFGNVERVPVLRVNFHGDVPASDVEIVSQKGFLRVGANAGFGKYVVELGLKLANALVSRKRHFVPGFGGIGAAALGFVGGCRKALTLFGRCMGHTGVHRLGAVSDVNTVLPEYPIHDLAGMPDVSGELINGLPSVIFVDKILSVEVVQFEGHVYNLQTEKGYYYALDSIHQRGALVNGYFPIVKNCRCSTAAAVSGWEDKTGRIVDDSQIENMTFAEWQASRVEKPHSITKQEEIAETMRQRYIRELYQPEGRIAASRDWRDVELPALENWTPPDTRRKKRK